MDIEKNRRSKYMYTGDWHIVPLTFQWDERKYEDADDILVIEQNLPLGNVNYCYMFQMISCNHPTSVPFRYYGVWGHKDKRESLCICESAEAEIVTEGMTTKYGMCRFEKSNFNYVLTQLLKGTFHGFGGRILVLSSKAIPLDAFNEFVCAGDNHPWEERVYIDFDRLAEYVLSKDAMLLKCNEGSGGKILMVVYEEPKWV